MGSLLHHTIRVCRACLIALVAVCTAGSADLSAQPLVMQSITFGGSGTDAVADIVIDDDGALYVVGTTDSPNLGASGLQPAKSGGTDLFIAKIGPNGTAPEWITYLGGANADTAAKIGVRGGFVYVAGTTASPDFPGRAIADCGVTPACPFLSRLSADGATLSYTAILSLPRGGGSAPTFHGVSVAPDGRAYVAVSGSLGFQCGIIEPDVTTWEVVHQVETSGAAAPLQSFRMCGWVPVMALDVGDDGDLYTGGQERGAEYWLKRFRADGTPVWSARSVWPSRIAVDAGGRVAVGSQIIGPDGVQIARPPLPVLPGSSFVEWRAVGWTPDGTVDGVLCRSAVGEGCAAIGDALAANPRATSIARATAFAVGQDDVIFAAGGSSDVTITKYGFVTIRSLTTDTRLGQGVSSGVKSIRYGLPITWRVTSTAPSRAEFRFLDYSDRTGFRELQPYGPATTVTWTPSQADIGGHVLQVWARAAGSAAQFEHWMTFGYEIHDFAPARLESLTVDRSPVVGRVATWWARSVQAFVRPEYKFVRLDADGWRVVQDYSDADTYSWMPGAADVGPHALQVWTRNVGSTAIYEDYRSVEFDVAPGSAAFTVSLGVIRTLPLHAGESVQFLTGAPTDVGRLEFKFVRRDGDSWHVVQEYASRSDYIWDYPRTSDIGPHDLQVWVRRVGSTALYEAWAGMSFSVAPPQTRIVGFPVPAKVTLGDTAQLFVLTPEGFGERLAKYIVLDADGWRIARDYSPDPTFLYAPDRLSDIGMHEIQVWVRGAGSSAIYESWAGAQIEVVAPTTTTVFGLRPNGPPPYTLGVPITWTAEVWNPQGFALEYMFVRTDGPLQFIARAYGASPTFTWTPMDGDQGPHTMAVWVRRVGSGVWYEWTRQTATFQVQ